LHIRKPAQNFFACMSSYELVQAKKAEKSRKKLKKFCAGFVMQVVRTQRSESIRYVVLLAYVTCRHFSDVIAKINEAIRASVYGDKTLFC
jgi:hypothetical protein